jgi:hypothetical protein
MYIPAVSETQLPATGEESPSPPAPITTPQASSDRVYVDNPRAKLFVHAFGFGVLFGSFVALATVGHSPHTPLPARSAIALGNQTRVMAGFAFVILTSVAIGVGRSGTRRMVGSSLRWIGASLRIRNRAYWSYANKHQTAPIGQPGRWHTCALAVNVVAGWALVFAVLQGTGGIVRSPFLQFAVSMFAWQVILADDKRARRGVLLGSVGFVIAGAFVPVASSSALIVVRPTFVAIITLVNLGFQLLPLSLEHAEES